MGRAPKGEGGRADGDCPNGDGREPNGEAIPWDIPDEPPNGEEVPCEPPNGLCEGAEPAKGFDVDELGVFTPQISSLPIPGGLDGDWLRASRLSEALGSALKPINISLHDSGKLVID